MLQQVCKTGYQMKPWHLILPSSFSLLLKSWSGLSDSSWFCSLQMHKEDIFSKDWCSFLLSFLLLMTMSELTMSEWLVLKKSWDRIEEAQKFNLHGWDTKRCTMQRTGHERAKKYCQRSAEYIFFQFISACILVQKRYWNTLQ